MLAFSKETITRKQIQKLRQHHNSSLGLALDHHASEILLIKLFYLFIYLFIFLSIYLYIYLFTLLGI